MNMVERVARAMAAGDSGPEGSYLFEIHWGEFGDGYMKSARAAIKAMREPNADMLGDGVSQWNTHDDSEEDVDCVYRAMIDATLQEDGQ